MTDSLREPSERRLLMIVDEHGTLGSDKDDEAYGYGFIMAEAGPRLGDLERELSNEFPTGFHLKNYRGDKRKLQNAKRMLRLLDEHPDVLAGAHVQQNPSYARDIYYRALAGKIDKPLLADISVRKAVAEAPLSENGLVDPNQVAPLSRGSGRLLTTYFHCLRFPIVRALHLFPEPHALDVEVRVGQVGRSETYRSQLKLLGTSLKAKLQESFAHYLNEGVVPAVPRSIKMHVIEADELPLFGFADLFAGVALHYHRHTRDPKHLLGRKLYDSAEPVLTRIGPLGTVLAPGISIME